MTQMHLSGEPKHPKRTVIFPIVLLLLAQTGWGLLTVFPLMIPLSQSSYLILNRIPILSGLPIIGPFITIWTIGMPLCYFLAGWLSALYATKGYSPQRARNQGVLIGAIEASGSVVLAALLLGVPLFWWIQTMRAQTEAECGLHPAHYCGLGFGWAIVIILANIVRPFLVANFFGLILAPLGGLLAGIRPANRPSQGEQFMPEKSGDRFWSASAATAFTFLALLAILLGSGFMLLLHAFYE